MMERAEATKKKKRTEATAITSSASTASRSSSPSAVQFPHINSIDIRLTPEFRCQSLLKDAWDVSPYNNKKNRGKESSSSLQERSDDVRAEIIDQAMCFQPKEGYCGIATVNTVTRSLDPPYYVPYGIGTYRAFSIDNLAKTLESINYQHNLFTKIEPIVLTEHTALDEFRCYLKEANGTSTTSCRILANFHRKTLFGTGYGHWSPIGAVVTKSKEEAEEEYVMVLDTNEKYGPFMVSLRRFFLAVKTPTSYGTFRGLIKVHLLPQY